MNVQRPRPSRLKLSIIVTAALIGIVSFFIQPWTPNTAKASAFGPAPTFSGAPGESNCTACHSSFPVNSGTGNVVVSGLPANYLPGQQIPVTVTVNQSDGVIFGFQMTALDHTGNRSGSYTIPSMMPPILQLDTGFVNGIERQYIHHTSNGLTPTEFGTKSWDFTWTAPPQRAGKISLFAAGNAADSDGGTSGDHIYTTSAFTLSGSGVSTFDGDNRNEVAVFRPSDGVWYSSNSSDAELQNVQWGMAGDIVTPGDFDGDGVTDRAVFRPSTGFWYLLQSTRGIEWVSFGQAEDVPVAGDYDGDLRTDVAVFRPSTGVWYILNSTGGVSYVSFGLGTDVPVQADYDGDARSDVAVFRPSNGVWYVLQSTGGVTYRQWGFDTDRPVQADYDGDGRHDIAVFRPSEGAWYISGSTDGFIAISWGFSTDIAIPADFDNDGRADVSVFRPSDGYWYALHSSDQSVMYRQWGLAGDVPIPAGYIPNQGF